MWWSVPARGQGGTRQTKQPETPDLNSFSSRGDQKTASSEATRTRPKTQRRGGETEEEDRGTRKKLEQQNKKLGEREKKLAEQEKKLGNKRRS